jgi:hypothetical protein
VRTTQAAGGAVAALLLALAGACGSPARPDAGAPPPTPTATPTATPVATPTVSPAPRNAAVPPPAVLVGAGDIASCDRRGDEHTAALLDDIPGTVFTLGDNVYPDGSAAEFARCYAPSWGRHRARTRPVVGNHEYRTRGAAGYFGYFGAAAGPRGRGWYSYDLGAWHVVALNTNCDVVSCAAGSPQDRWLRDDLAASAARGVRCAVALGHHPLFTSGTAHPPTTAVRPLVRTLRRAGVELLLTGHNHQYERFAPQDEAGRRDAAGIRQFVVGTGGAGGYGFGPAARNSEVRHTGTYGVLRLTLRADGYDWRFVAEPGDPFTDTGRGRCH